MVWNVQGAGSLEFQAVLREFIRLHKPMVLVLTRVEAQGFSGGIWVFLKSELVYIDPIEQSNQYITLPYTQALIHPNAKNYGELSDFASRHDKPWLLAGDFNETRFSWERNSSCGATSRRTSQFNYWVEAHHLLEVEFSGPTHTWSRGNTTDTHRSARLDRALCSTDWGLRFNKAHKRILMARIAGF
ncbi:Aspartate--tRNA(Asp/Asn) ligase [Bienertia sinuspersici]